MIENKIKYTEDEIPKIISFRKKQLENQIENHEDSIKKIKEYRKDRNDLYEYLKSLDFNKSFIIVCWEGDQGKNIDRIINLDIESIKNINYRFDELVKYIL